jgi:hypothetical protein
MNESVRPESHWNGRGESAARACLNLRGKLTLAQSDSIAIWGQTTFVCTMLAPASFLLLSAWAVSSVRVRWHLKIESSVICLRGPRRSVNERSRKFGSVRTVSRGILLLPVSFGILPDRVACNQDLVISSTPRHVSVKDPQLGCGVKRCGMMQSSAGAAP